MTDRGDHAPALPPDPERREAIGAAAEARRTARGPETSADDAPFVVVEERLALSKRRVSTGSVRIETRTEVHEEMAEVELDRHHVEVTRVPVGRPIEAPPPTRTEGDTTIIPVVEERLVLVKQLFLKEELHIRHVVARETVREAVTLRRQHAIVSRRDPD